MNSAYYFAFAAILAVIPILLLYKINVEKIKENPDDFGSVQTKFFIGVAISETLPIILIVLGMMDLTSASSMEELYIPGLIVIISFIFAPFFILLQKSVGVPEEAKQKVNTFSMISWAMVNAIPIISLVGLLMMLP